jgi:hypothetical protein
MKNIKPTLRNILVWLLIFISIVTNAQSNRKNYSYLKKIKRHSQTSAVLISGKKSTTEKAFYNSTENDIWPKPKSGSEVEIASLQMNDASVLKMIGNNVLANSDANYSGIRKGKSIGISNICVQQRETNGIKRNKVFSKAVSLINSKRLKLLKFGSKIPNKNSNYKIDSDWFEAISIFLGLIVFTCWLFANAPLWVFVIACTVLAILIFFVLGFIIGGGWVA